MRSLLGRLGMRGVAVIAIAAVVLGVVGVARVASRGNETPPYIPQPPVTSTVDPTSGDDGVAALPTEHPDDAMVTAAAETFTAAWLSRDLSAAAWLAGLTPLVTPPLAKSLEGVDPKVVPATRTLAAPTIELRTLTNARTSTAVDTGTLLLGLTKEQNRWLVETIDWDRA